MELWVDGVVEFKKLGSRNGHGPVNTYNVFIKRQLEESESGTLTFFSGA